MDEKHDIVRPGATVVDLGSAPGSWLQYAQSRVGKGGLAIGVDLLPLAEPMPHFIRGDFLAPETQQRVADVLREHGKTRVDVVLSDMLHNVGGERDVDAARSIELCEAALAFALRHFSAERGVFLAKYYASADADCFLRRSLRPAFSHVASLKPRASRGESREQYFYAVRGSPDRAERPKHPILDALALGVADALS